MNPAELAAALVRIRILLANTTAEDFADELDDFTMDLDGKPLEVADQHLLDDDGRDWAPTDLLSNLVFDALKPLGDEPDGHEEVRMCPVWGADYVQVGDVAAWERWKQAADEVTETTTARWRARMVAMLRAVEQVLLAEVGHVLPVMAEVA